MLEKISTGVEGLDRLTGGGFLLGSAYIIQGPPGAGKTLLANQFCFAHVRSGGRALYMSLLAESSARMLNYISQMAFFDTQAVPESMQYISAYGVLEREGLPGLLKLVQHELRRFGATAMVLDGTFVAQSVASEQEFRAFIHALQGVAGVANAVLVMLTHQNRDSSSPEHTMVDGWIEMRDEMFGYRSYQSIQVRKHRGAGIIRGKHRIRITEHGVAVFPRIESCISHAPSDEALADRVSVGLSELDRLLEGGLPYQSATLLLGPTGSGKTTLGMHFLSTASVEAPGLMLGFYETPARLLMKARSLNIDLDRLVEQGALTLMWLPPADILPDEIAMAVVRQAKASGAKRIFIDGLIPLRDNLVDSERMPYFVNALSLNLREIGATVVYTSETKEISIDDAVMPSDELSSMVDNVLLVSTGHRGPASKRSLSVIKLRDGGFYPLMQEFHIGDKGLMFGSENVVPHNARPG